VQKEGGLLFRGPPCIYIYIYGCFENIGPEPKAKLSRDRTKCF